MIELLHVLMLALGWGISYYVHAHPLQQLKPLQDIVSKARQSALLKDLMGILNAPADTSGSSPSGTSDPPATK